MSKVIQSKHDAIFVAGLNQDGRGNTNDILFVTEPANASSFVGQVEAEAFMEQTLTNFLQKDGGNEVADDHFLIVELER